MNIGLIDTSIDTHRFGLASKVKGSLVLDDEGFPVSERPRNWQSDHGTFDAFLLCGERQSVEDIILFPEADLFVCSCLDGNKLALNMVKSLDWMLTQPIKVLAMPFGEHGGSPFLTPLVQQLVEKGILPVAAIGNKGAGHYSAPGGYTNVLSVGAADQEGNPAAFSGSKNNPDTSCLKPDILAPGVGLNNHLEALKPQNGTSAASVYVAGIAAQLFEAFPGATSHDIYEALVNTAIPLDSKWRHRCRTGNLQIDLAADFLSEHGIGRTHSGLLPQGIVRTIDSHLTWQAKYSPIDKQFEALIILREGLDLQNRYPDIQILDRFGAGAIDHVSVTASQVLQLSKDQGVLVMQDVKIPPFSF